MSPTFVIPEIIPNAVTNAGAAVFAAGASSGDATGVQDLANIMAIITAAQARFAVTGAMATAQLQSGATYTVSTPNSITAHAPSGSSFTLTYGIAIPSGVYLDLNGATIKAASGATGQVIVNATPTVGGGDHDLGVGNGIVDGNNSAGASNAVVGWMWTTRPIVKGRLRVINGVRIGIYPYGNSQGEYDTLIADTIAGNGIFLGNSPANGMESEVRCHRAVGRNCTTWTTQAVNFPGNSVVVATNQNSEIGVIHGVACSGGIKVENICQDTQIEIAGTWNSVDTAQTVGNSGFKLQGSGNGTPLRVNVGLVMSEGQRGNGLYMEQGVDCSVDRYIGQGNAIDGPGFTDVWIGGRNDHVGFVQSNDCGGPGVLVRGYAMGYRLGEVIVRNPNTAATATTSAVSVAGGNGSFGYVESTDGIYSPQGLAGVPSTSGGAFAAGSYFWVLTATNANGETLASNEVGLTLTGTTSSVVLTWPAVTGATNYKLYRATSSNGQTAASSLVATTGNVLTYTDTGAAVGAGSIPTYNSASTGNMYRGFDVTSALASVRVTALKVTGWSNAAFNLAGTSLMRAQNIAAGPPWQGQIVLAAEPIAPTNNYTATTDPLVTSDSAAGYAVGSQWCNTTSKALYECVDATASAAVWRRLSGAVVQVFLTSANWTKPAWCRKVTVAAIAPGGGGASGRQTASGTAASGGAGGGGGGYGMQIFNADELTSSVSVVVSNAGGAGGAAQASASTNGNPGSTAASGGVTSFGSVMRLLGGSGGGAGSTSASTGGGGGAALVTGALGGAGSLTAVGGNGGTGAMAGAGGGAGGGLATVPAVLAGGAGGTSVSANLALGTAGTTDGQSGGIGTSVTDLNIVQPGTGGGGGASSILTTGGTGGAGGSYGTGGGGGGASLNGSASGAGGAGGPGIVVVIAE